MPISNAPVDPVQVEADRIIRTYNTAEGYAISAAKSITATLAAQPDGGDAILAKLGDSGKELLKRVSALADLLNIVEQTAAIDKTNIDTKSAGLGVKPPVVSDLAAVAVADSIKV